MNSRRIGLVMLGLAVSVVCILVTLMAYPVFVAMGIIVSLILKFECDPWSTCAWWGVKTIPIWGTFLGIVGTVCIGGIVFVVHRFLKLRSNPEIISEET